MDQEGQQRQEEEKEGKGSEGYASSELGGGKLGNFGSSIPTTTFSLFKFFFLTLTLLRPFLSQILDQHYLFP